MTATTLDSSDDDTKQKSRDDLTSGSVLSGLRDLWLPMIGGVLAVKAIGLSDAYFIGQLGEEPLAAVSYTFPITMLLISLAIGLSSGASSVLSRRIGASANEDDKKAIVLGTMALSLGLAIIMGVIGALVIGSVFSLMGASGDILADATSYMQIWFAGALFLILPIVANGLLRATGDGISPAVLMSGIAVLNIAINPLLIFGIGIFPDLGMHGAAVATVFARAVATLGAIALLMHKDLLSLSLQRLKDGVRDWSEIVRIAAPASLSTSLNPFALSLATAAVATLGQADVAAFGVATKVQSIAIVPLLALSSASAPFAGQNSGAGYTDRTRTMLFWCAGIAAAWAALTAATFWFAGDLIASQFVSSEASAGRLALYLSIVPLSWVGYGIVISLSSALNGLGRSLMALGFSGGRAMLMLAPAAWIGVTLGDFAGLAWGFLAANALSGAIALFAVWRLPLSEAGEPSSSDDSETGG